MNSQHRWLLRWLRKVGELTKFAICTGNHDLWEGFCDPFEGVDEFVIVDGKSEILRVGEAMHHVPPSDAKFCPQETFGEGKPPQKCWP